MCGRWRWGRGGNLNWRWRWGMWGWWWGAGGGGGGRRAGGGEAGGAGVAVTGGPRWPVLWKTWREVRLLVLGTAGVVAVVIAAHAGLVAAGYSQSIAAPLEMPQNI